MFTLLIVKDIKFQDTTVKHLLKCFSCSFSVAFNIPTIFWWAVIAVGLKEPVSLMAWWLWKSLVGASSRQWGPRREPPGCASHRWTGFSSLLRHLSWGKKSRPMGKFAWTAFLVKSPLTAAHSETLLDFSLLIPEIKGSPWSKEEASRMPKWRAFRRGFSCFYCLSLFKYTDVLWGNIQRPY